MRLNSLSAIFERSRKADEPKEPVHIYDDTLAMRLACAIDSDLVFGRITPDEHQRLTEEVCRMAHIDERLERIETALQKRREAKGEAQD